MASLCKKDGIRGAFFMGDNIQIEGTTGKKIRIVWLLPVSVLGLLLGLAGASVRYSFQAGAYYTESSLKSTQMARELILLEARLKVVEQSREFHSASIAQLDRSVVGLLAQAQSAQQERKEDFSKLNQLVWDIRERLAAVDAKLGTIMERRQGAIDSFPFTASSGLLTRAPPGPPDYALAFPHTLARGGFWGAPR